MKNYAALIEINGLTEVVNVIAKNLKSAKAEASKSGNVIMIGVDEVGAKIYN